jgi:hypothetical protein
VSSGSDQTEQGLRDTERNAAQSTEPQDIYLNGQITSLGLYPVHTCTLNLVDIPDQWLNVNEGPGHYTDPNLVVILTRYALASTNNMQPQSQSWEGTNVSGTLTTGQG